MVSEIRDDDGLIQQPKKNLISPGPRNTLPLSLVWTANGGVAANGVKYGQPGDAIAWGRKGCPLLPRAVRESHKGLKLPRELQCTLGASLSVDQLDADVFELFEGDTVWQTPPREFRDFLYILPILPSLVVVPAGIPLIWFQELPLSGCTGAAVQKAFSESGGDEVGFLRVPMRAQQFLEIRSVGITAMNEILCVMESIELGSADQEPTIDVDDTEFYWELAIHEHLTAAPSLLSGKSISTFIRNFREFVSWAIAETDAQFLGEAISELMEDERKSDAWEPVSSTRLTDLAVSPPHPYEVIDRWIDQMDPRWTAIFTGRVSHYPHRNVTLEELGARFGVTRQRILQVEAKVRHALKEFLKTDKALPIRWRALTLRRKLSVAAPSLSVEHLLAPPPGCNDHRCVMLDLAGPYDHERDWLILRSAQSNDPTSSIVTQTDEVGRINKGSATSQLTEWGLDVSFHEDWLMRDDSVRLFNGQLIRWGTSISDRLAFALSDLARPATIDEMIAHVRENRARNSIVNALGSDTRLVRVGRRHWALSSWNLPTYAGIAESMRKLVEEFGGSVPLNSMVHRMRQLFDVEEGSTLAYSSAPMFAIEGKSLRLRTKEDDPYRYDSDLMKRTPGVFKLGPMRLGRLLRVDNNMLRGSGMSLSHAGGSILEVEVNAQLSFRNQNGYKVDLTFPETSIAGPSIGSVRRIAEGLSAKEGNYLTLLLDRNNMSFSVELTDLNAQTPGWNVIGRLTGIGTATNLGSLAKSMDCGVGEVRTTLQARGDDEILKFLPTSGASIGLDDALSELEGLFESEP